MGAETNCKAHCSRTSKIASAGFPASITYRCTVQPTSQSSCVQSPTASPNIDPAAAGCARPAPMHIFSPLPMQMGMGRIGKEAIAAYLKPLLGMETRKPAFLDATGN